MAAVRDPAFWRRFSVAVHLDDADKEARQQQRPALKHSYVKSLSPPSTVTSPGLPTSPTTPMSPVSPTMPPPALCRQPSKLTKAPPRRVSTHQSTLPTRHNNSSTLTLGLSGRPPSRFNFWTSITANESPRDSWLEAQLKKKRQRTWMCWFFWLVFFAVVAGVVIVILLLKAKKII